MIGGALSTAIRYGMKYSNDDYCKIGCTIINDKYDHLAIGCNHLLKQFDRFEDKKDYMVSADMSCILGYKERSFSDTFMVCPLLPMVDTAKMIGISGITGIICSSRLMEMVPDNWNYEKAKQVLTDCGVDLFYFQPFLNEPILFRGKEMLI